MTNIFFEDEQITENDLYFLCYMIERVARKIHQRNRYVVNQISREEWLRLISLANVLHCENPLKIESEWIEDYQLQEGTFYIQEVDPNLVTKIPSETQMGKVYTRLIVDTQLPDEDYVQGMFRVYNDEICEKIDDYNCSAYYEPSYVIARAYNDGGF
ncbi:MAG: hypothetical protein ACI4HI_10495 [Lachnospiraceae bacterium]